MQKTLLDTLLPSTDVLRGILDRIREKYNIPEVMPENEQLAELLQSNDFYDWKAIRDDLEKELRKELQLLLPQELPMLFQGFMEMASKSHGIKELEGLNVEINDPNLAMIIGSMMQGVPGVLQYLDQVFAIGAQKLLDHLITGRPIEVPKVWFNLIGSAKFPAGENGEKFVIAVAHQFSDPDEIANEFRKKIIGTFGEKPKLKEADLETAEYLAMRNTDKSIGDILTVFLDRHPNAIPYAKGTKKYNDKLRLLKDAMRQRL